MPSQQVEIRDAIAGIKRALKRQREAPSDQLVVAASNRGNKLQQGARYVHEGSLTHSSGPEVNKKKIDHAGYTRYILDLNPRRYNEYGEELEDSETDEEADADAADQNAYSGIRLEEILCPLKHPSELPTHPTLSPAYLSKALPEMVLSTHEKLRQERANLWRAKYLNRQLTGDASWIPAGKVESSEDWGLFEPRHRWESRQPPRRRKRQRVEPSHQNGMPGQSSIAHTVPNGASNGIGEVADHQPLAEPNGNGDGDKPERDKTIVVNGQVTNGDLTKIQEAVTGAEDSASKSADVSIKDAVTKGATDIQLKTHLNGLEEGTFERNGTASDPDLSACPPSQENNASTQLECIGAKAGDSAELVPHAASHGDDGSPPPPPPPPPPPRRITRALAANNTSNTHSNAPTPPLSPASSNTTTSSSSQLQIDPLYLVPASANPSHPTLSFHGLPPEEALETRRLLTLYVQKQEESVKGYESILSKLLTAQRLRTEVLDMCKTEEHVGALSDGEDWIDAERWGLQPGELRKGRDEEEDVLDENTIGGRKGKRRARN